MKIWYQSGLNFERFKSYEQNLKNHIGKAADTDTTVDIFGTSHGGTGVEYRFTEYLFTRSKLKSRDMTPLL